jgi:transposase
MSKRGIFWVNDAGEFLFDAPPPYPSFNAMTAVMNNIWARYVSAGTASALFERYDKAAAEISKEHRRLLNLTREQAKTIQELNQQLAKWTSQHGKGKRQSPKTNERIAVIRDMKASGASNRKIAEFLSISEGTVRNLLKRMEPANT